MKKHPLSLVVYARMLVLCFSFVQRLIVLRAQDKHKCWNNKLPQTQTYRVHLCDHHDIEWKREIIAQKLKDWNVHV